MDENRRSFRAFIALLFICLTIESNRVMAIELGSRTGGYTPSHRNAMNSTKVKSDVIYSNGWTPKFDPNYFASLNAANHRQIDTTIRNPIKTQPKEKTNSSSTSSSNIYYYSPKNYGKTTHTTNKVNLSENRRTSSTTTTTTTKSTTPPPNTSHKPSKVSYDSEDNSSSIEYKSEEFVEEEEPTYMSPNKENRRQQYLHQNRLKQRPINQYYGTDLSPMPSLNKVSISHKLTKLKNFGNSFVPSFEPKQEIRQNNEKSYAKPPPNNYYGVTPDPYYPPYYPPQYPSNSDMNSNQGPGSGSSFGSDPSSDMNSGSGMNSGRPGSGSELKTGTWLGPGIAGLIIGILPLATLIASIIPAFISVPVISTSAFSRRRKRDNSEEDLLALNNTQMILNSGVLEILSKYGMSSLEDPKCLTEMLCTFAAEGRHSKNNSVQNFVYSLIDLTPNQLAKWLTVDTLFNAVKRNKCEHIYQCITKRVKFEDIER